MSRYVQFTYRSTKMGAYTKTYIIRDGNIVYPVYVERSRTGNHGIEYYNESDVKGADVILHIDISNSGKHYCKLDIIKPNPKSIQLALEIHRCYSIDQYASSM